jgi:transposase
VLTDPAGRPVTVRVFAGNTGDPTAFTEIVKVVKNQLGITKLALVGDRGMITAARIEALRELTTTPAPPLVSTGSPHYAHPQSPNSPATTAHCK